MIDLIEVMDKGKEKGKNDKEVVQDMCRSIKEVLQEMGIEEFGKITKSISYNHKKKKYYIALEIDSTCENEADQSLTDKDTHCIARLLQSSIFTDSIFYGCNFCKYRADCFTNNKPYNMHDDALRSKLQKITGVDLSPSVDRDNIEEKFRNNKNQEKDEIEPLLLDGSFTFNGEYKLNGIKVKESPQERGGQKD